MYPDQKRVRSILQSIKVKQVMTSPVVTLQDTDRFDLVSDKFALYGIRHLPVVNEIGAVVGLITQRSMYKIHSPRRLDDGTWYYDKEALNQFILKNVMLPNPFTLTQDNTLQEAIEALIRFKFGCIIIIDELRKPCGLLTPVDVLKFLSTE